jgi:two-component system, response regulator / RNA-binding antiterminator
MSESGLNILVIDENPERAAIVERGLIEAGYLRASVIHNTADLISRIEALRPDVVIIDLGNPDRDTLEEMFQVSRAVRRPIAMFVDKSDSAMIRAAIEAGVSAYVVDGLTETRIRPLVETAITRFQAFDQLRQERDDAQAKLADRKIIEKAKGLLMKSKSISEDEAYATMRSTAMKQNRRLVDIAQVVITAFEMDLGGGAK